MPTIHLKKLVLFAVLAISFAPCIAQDARTELVKRIAVSQGLQEIINQQLTEQRESLKGYASKILNETNESSGKQSNAKERAAFDRFLERAGGLFSAEEITSAWTSSYGKDLSVQELQEVLNYYESPIGRKDVAANRVAMVAFSAWMNREAQIRASALLKEFNQDLQAAR